MEWRNEKRKIEDLKPSKYNPRKINAKNKADLRESLDRFDVVDPIIINTNGNIIGGHQRFEILRSKGVTEVDCRVPDEELSEASEKELNLRLNKNQGEFDLGLLTAFDPAMLTLAGFDGDLVDSLFNLDAKEDDFNESEAYKKIDIPITIDGDIYEFDGGHRLMCGSSDNFGSVEKLMGGGRADLIYTDPPFNVDYGYSAGRFKSKKVFSDDIKDEDFFLFLCNVFTNAMTVSHDHVNIYCWFAMRHYQQFRDGIESSGFKYLQVIYWLKDSLILSHGADFHRITEPCFIFYKDWNKRFKNLKYAKNTEVWQMDRLTFEESLEVWYQHRDSTKEYKHPTQKPIRLGERALKRSSEVGHIVLDLFGGSGSTLLCCHQLERKCYTMELDPKYCDVIVDRFTKMTGKAPVRM